MGGSGFLSTYSDLHGIHVQARITIDPGDKLGARKIEAILASIKEITSGNL
jgi:hypothetical protein